MKKICKGALIGALFLCLTSCVSGNVENKRVGKSDDGNIYQLKIDDKNVLAPDDFWLTVTEKQWFRCQIGEHYPDCRQGRQP